MRVPLRRGGVGGAAPTFAQAPATSGTWHGHLLCPGRTLPGTARP